MGTAKTVDHNYGRKFWVTIGPVSYFAAVKSNVIARCFHYLTVYPKVERHLGFWALVATVSYGLFDGTAVLLPL